MAQSFESNIPGLPKTFIETVRAGEQSGALEACFKRLYKRRRTGLSKHPDPGATQITPADGLAHSFLSQAIPVP
jgi:hypothetical protein